MRRDPKPVPLAPRHQLVWRRLRRRCSCGLPWRGCPDRYGFIAYSDQILRVPPWHNARTDVYPIVSGARSPLGMTPGQEYRANRRWPV